MILISAFMSALTGLKAASDLTTRLREAIGNREVKLDEVVARIIEIQGFIGDGRAALIDLQEQLIAKTAEIQELQHKIQELEDDGRFRGSLKFRHGVYCRTADDGTEEAYCSACLDIDSKRVRLSDHVAGYHCHLHGIRA